MIEVTESLNDGQREDIQQILKTAAGKEPKQAIEILAKFISKHRNQSGYLDDLEKCRRKIGGLLSKVNGNN